MLMLLICGPRFDDHWSCGNLNLASIWVDWGIILQGLIVYLPLSDSLSGVWAGERKSLRSFWWLGFSVLSGLWAHCPFYLPDQPLQVKATVCWWSSYPRCSPFPQTRNQHALADSEAAVFAPDPDLCFTSVRMWHGCSEPSRPAWFTGTCHWEGVRGPGFCFWADFRLLVWPWAILLVLDSPILTPCVDETYFSHSQPIK